MVDKKTEEKTELIPTREMTLLEKKDVIKQAAGRALALNKFPDNTRWAMKIVDEPTVFVDKKDTEATEEEKKKCVYWNVEFKHNNIKIPARIRTSHAALLSVQAKYPNAEYIGRYAFFSHLKKGDNNIHSIGVFKTNEEPKEFTDTEDELRKAEETSAEETSAEEAKPDTSEDIKTVAEFIAKFKEQIAKFNTMCDEKGKSDEKRKCTADLCQLQYMRVKHPEEYKLIKETFGD